MRSRKQTSSAKLGFTSGHILVIMYVLWLPGCPEAPYQVHPLTLAQRPKRAQKYHLKTVPSTRPEGTFLPKARLRNPDPLATFPQVWRASEALRRVLKNLPKRSKCLAACGCCLVPLYCLKWGSRSSALVLGTFEASQTLL